VIFAPSLHNAYSGTAFPGIVDSLYSDIAADDTEGWNQVKVNCLPWHLLLQEQ